MGISKEEVFRKLLNRSPTAEERARLEQMRQMTTDKDDPLWYFILVYEFYEARFSQRLKEVDSISSTAANKALEEISKTFKEKVDEAAAAEAKAIAERVKTAASQAQVEANKALAEVWATRSFYLSLLILFGAICIYAGYLTGTEGKNFGLFLDIPAGWLASWGSLPFLLIRFIKAKKDISDAVGKRKANLYLQELGYLLLIILAGSIILSFF